MKDPLSKDLIAALGGLSTCSVANAIERFDVRLRNEGFSDPSISCRFPHLPPIVGYAVTLRVRSRNPPMEGGTYTDRTEWWEEIADDPIPRIVVIQDIDRRPGGGAYIGEVHAAILQAMNCVAVVTNGAVRDLPDVAALGFQCFSSSVSVSHSYGHVVEVGGVIEIAGMRISPGDLLHGDQHGFLKIPPEIADRIPPLAAEVHARERKILSYCRSSQFTRDGLRQFLTTTR